jgi:hypothetical protein
MTKKLFYFNFDITFKLFHENCFMQITIQKFQFDVILNDMHVMDNNKCKYCPNGLIFVHRKIGLITINVITLGVTNSYQTCLLISKGTIRMSLDLIYPFDFKAFRPKNRWTKSQIIFFMKDSYYSFMASCQ